MSAAAATSTLRTVMPLMSMPRMAAATVSASSALDASFTPPALPRPPTRTWALITTALGAGRQDPLRGGARLGHGVGDLPVGYGQALGDEQGLGVGFLDLHEARQLRLAGRVGERWYRVGPRPRTVSERTAGIRLAILDERGHVGRAAAEGRDAAGTRGASDDGAIMTPSPRWQAPRSSGWTPPPGSSCAIPTRPRTPSRRRSSAPGVTCPHCAAPIASTPGSTGCSYRACIDEARRLRRHRVDVELDSHRRAVDRRRRVRRPTTATSSNAASAASSRRRGP